MTNHDHNRVFVTCCKKLEVEALTKKHEINEPDYQAVIYTHIPYHCPTGRNKAA